jgi:hypothetical protein
MSNGLDMSCVAPPSQQRWEARHAQVGDRQIEGLSLGPFDGGAAALRGGDLVAHRREDRVQGLTDVGLVVDHQDPRRAGRAQIGRARALSSAGSKGLPR